MQLTVFGATGSIGQLLVKKALDEGYEIKAYVRSPEKFTFTHMNLELLKGELNAPAMIQKAIAGTDVVVSTLGPPLVLKYEGMPIFEGHRNIIKAMIAENVSRLITLATPSVKSSEDRVSTATVLPGMLARLLYPKAYREIVQVGEIVSLSGLDWTIVRIIAPEDTPAAGKVIVTYGDSKIRWRVSRSDIADFMLSEVKAKQYIHSMPIIGGTFTK